MSINFVQLFVSCESFVQIIHIQIYVLNYCICFHLFIFYYYEFSLPTLIALKTLKKKNNLQDKNSRHKNEHLPINQPSDNNEIDSLDSSKKIAEMDKNIESLLEKNFEDWINESMDEEENTLKKRHKKENADEIVERVLDQQGLDNVGVVNKDAEALSDFKVGNLFCYFNCTCSFACGFSWKFVECFEFFIINLLTTFMFV